MVEMIETRLRANKGWGEHCVKHIREKTDIQIEDFKQMMTLWMGMVSVVDEVGPVSVDTLERCLAEIAKAQKGHDGLTTAYKTLVEEDLGDFVKYRK